MTKEVGSCQGDRPSVQGLDLGVLGLDDALKLLNLGVLSLDGELKILNLADLLVGLVNTENENESFKSK